MSKPDRNVYSDALKSYEGIDEFCHQFVDHAIEYVRGHIHTDGLENFWSLLKRGLNGTYISVEPFHLFRYLDEPAFRYNNRKDEDGEVRKDADRFDQLVMQIVGRRLTYTQLIGKEAEKTRHESFLRRNLIGSAGGSFPGFPLRFWAALARIERGLFFVLRFARLKYGARHRYDLTHESVEVIELGGMFHLVHQ